MPTFSDPKPGPNDSQQTSRGEENKNFESPEPSERLVEDAKLYVKRYFSSIMSRNKNTASEFLWEAIKEHYGADPESEWFKKLSRKIDPIIFPFIYPASTRHLLLEGPPGTGKSAFMLYLLQSLGGSPLTLDSYQVKNPLEIRKTFELARLYKRVLVEQSIEYKFNKHGEITQSFVERIDSEITSKIIKSLKFDPKKYDEEKRSIVYSKLKGALLSVFPRKEEIVKFLAPSSKLEANAKLAEVKEALKEALNEFEDLKDQIIDAMIINSVARVIPFPPVVILIDEIDSIGNRDLDSNPALNELLNSLNGSAPLNYTHGISTIAATNVVGLLDEALIRPGRFEKFTFLYPSIDAREKIVNIMLSNFSTSDFHINRKSIKDILTLIPVTTGADILSLANRISEERAEHSLTEELNISDERVKEIIGELYLGKSKTIGHHINIRGIDYYLSKIFSDSEISYKLGSNFDRMLAIRRMSLDFKKKFSSNQDEDLRLLDELNAFEKYPLSAQFSKLSEVLSVYTLIGEGAEIRVLNESMADIIALSVFTSTVTYIVGRLAKSETIPSDPYIIAEVNLSSTLAGIVGQMENNLKKIFDLLNLLGNSVVLLKGMDSYSHQRSFSTTAEVNVIREGIDKLVNSGTIVIYSFPSTLPTPNSPDELSSPSYTGLLPSPNALFLSFIISDLEMKMFRSKGKKVKEDSNSPKKHFGLSEFFSGVPLKEKSDPQLVENYRNFLRELDSRYYNAKQSLRRKLGKLER